MAKKPRTPPPPRRPVQAPKRRDTRTGSLGASRRPPALLLSIVALLVVIAIVLSIVAFGGGKGSPSTNSVTKAMAAAGCTLRNPPILDHNHLTTLTPAKPPHYDSFPPTSGTHYYTPAIFGIYTTPLNQYQALHNLEHGAVDIQYGSKVPQADVQGLTSFYQSDTNALLVAPLPRLGDKIALTAWGHIATCTHFNQSAFAAFRNTFRYHGRENFPPSALNPGQ